MECKHCFRGQWSVSQEDRQWTKADISGAFAGAKQGGDGHLLNLKRGMFYILRWYDVTRDRQWFEKSDHSDQHSEFVTGHFEIHFRSSSVGCE